MAPASASTAASAKKKRSAKRPRKDLVKRIQALLYDFEEIGKLRQARPHIIWLMEIAIAAQAFIDT